MRSDAPPPILPRVFLAAGLALFMVVLFARLGWTSALGLLERAARSLTQVPYAFYVWSLPILGLATVLAAVALGTTGRLSAICSLAASAVGFVVLVAQALRGAATLPLVATIACMGAAAVLLRPEEEKPGSRLAAAGLLATMLVGGWIWLQPERPGMMRQAELRPEVLAALQAEARSIGTDGGSAQSVLVIGDLGCGATVDALTELQRLASGKNWGVQYLNEPIVNGRLSLWLEHRASRSDFWQVVSETAEANATEAGFFEMTLEAGRWYDGLGDDAPAVHREWTDRLRIRQVPVIVVSDGKQTHVVATASEANRILGLAGREKTGERS